MVDYTNDIRHCLRVLNEGGTILYPTDTVWGIGCDATNEAAVVKVFALKDRPQHKSLIVLLPDARDILKHVAAPPPDIISLVESYEEPTTFVFSGAIGFAENAIGDDGSIAIRVPKDAFCKTLLKQFGRPIISTSANISGAATATVFPEIDKQILLGCDYAVQYRQEDLRKTTPSRILKIDDDGKLLVLRG